MENNPYSFTLLDKTGRIFDKVGDTFYLSHNSEFQVVFYNESNKRANVEFILDGTAVGEFRSNPHSNIKIERPVKKDKVFTFVSVDSEEGKQGRLDLAPKLGTIEILVDPEQTYAVCDSARNQCGFDETDSCSLAPTGGTVLGVSSKQRFTFAAFMPTTGNIVKLYAKMMVKTNVESIHQ